jgi:hypothetical protein
VKHVFAQLLIAPALVLSLTAVSVDARSLITPKTSQDSAAIQADRPSKTLNADTSVKKPQVTQRPGRTGRALRKFTQND